MISVIMPRLGGQVPEWIQKTAAYPMLGPSAAATKAAELPYTPTRVGPGGGVSVGGGAPSYIVPTIQKQLMPDGSYADFYVSPPTPQNPQGTRQYIGPSAPSAKTQAGETKSGEIGAQHAPLEPAAPAAPAPGQPGAPPARGTPLAAGLNSKMPDYREPAYSDFDLQKYGDDWVKRSQDMTSTIGAAQTAEQRLTTIAGAFKQIQTGAFMTDKAAFNATLTSIFGPNAAGFFRDADPATVEKALHENYKATLQGLATVNKRFTNNEFNVTSEKSENPNLQPEANLTMLSEDIGQLRQLKALGTDWVEARINGKRDPETFQTKWLGENPLAPIVDAVRKEIGPLKGMQQTVPDGSSITMPDGQILRNEGGKFIIRTPGPNYGQQYQAPAQGR